MPNLAKIQNAYFLRTDFHDFTGKIALKDIEFVESVTKLESPFKESAIYTQLKVQSREHQYFSQDQKKGLV